MYLLYQLDTTFNAVQTNLLEQMVLSVNQVSPVRIPLVPTFFLDPFFQFRYQPVGWPQVVTIHRSNVIKKSLSPKWEPFELGVGLIGGLDQPFTLQVYGT